MTRRRWLATAAAAVCGACGRHKGTGFPGIALIATAGEDSLATVDLNNFQLGKSVSLGAPPTAVLSGNRKDRALAVTGSNGTLHVIGRDLERVSSRKVADALRAVQFSADGLLLVAATEGEELLLLDANSLRTLRRFKLAGRAIALDVAGLKVAVSSGDRGVVQLFDLATGSQPHVELGGPAGAVCFRWDAQLLLAANHQSCSLTALDVPSLQVVADLPLAMHPDNLCFNADGGQLFVSGRGLDAVGIVFPYGILEVEQTILAGRDPGAMVCSPAFLFVASEKGSDISVLDIETRRVIGSVQVGASPQFLTLTPDGQYALILDRASGDLAVIRIPPIHWDRNRTGVSLFTLMSVGAQPIDLAIVEASA
jgi:YVTN family beta-propeller protein